MRQRTVIQCIVLVPDNVTGQDKQGVARIVCLWPSTLGCRKSAHIFNNNRGETMDITGLVIFLAIGAVAGWLAGTLMKGGGFGLLGNIVIGIIGAVVGGHVFSLLGITAGGLIGSIITATAGAVLLLFVVRLIKQA
jgi:uncharacterized membrane protein YeaQ/YmgE (transglycosylase-associated protein family)